MPAEGVRGGGHPAGLLVANLPSLGHSRSVSALCVWRLLLVADAPCADQRAHRPTGQRRAPAPILGTFHPRVSTLVQLSTASVMCLAPAAQNFGDHHMWLQTGIPILKTQPASVSAPKPHFGVQRFASPRSLVGTGRLQGLGEQTEGHPQALRPRQAPCWRPHSLSALQTSLRRTPSREGVTLSPSVPPSPSLSVHS